MKEVDIYTDGACSGNPGKGGYGIVLIYKKTIKEISGGAMHTTNNRMELLAIIVALKALKEKCNVNIYSDSAYCVNAINNGWLEKWKAFGYKKSIKSDSDIKNVDLWQELDPLINYHSVTFIKVKGHSDNKYNNRCDEIARNAIANLKE